MNKHAEGLSEEQLGQLRRVLHSPILTPDNAEYDQRRRVWNGMIDRKPAAIVRPTSIADVIQTVHFARERGIVASVRGGGHSVAGKAVADSVMMIDLSLMREVQVDAGKQTALAQGGAIWAHSISRARSSGLPRPVA